MSYPYEILVVVAMLISFARKKSLTKEGRVVSTSRSR